MTIGYLLDDTLDRSDGVQQAMIMIAEHMRSLGHEVHYLVAETKRKDLQNIHELSRYLNLRFNGNSVRTPLPAKLRDVTRLLDGIDFDVIHVQMPYSPFMAAKVIRHAKRRGVRIVGTFHILPYGFASRFGTKLLGWLLRRTNKMLDAAMAVTEPALAFMREGFGVSGSVLPNPVDFNFFNKFAQKNANHREEKAVVFVGRFEERKGVLELLAAYEDLSEQTRRHTRMIMCGKGPLSESVAERVRAKKLNIVLPGFVSEEEKAKYLAAADIALFPSIGGESFGIVLTEAMSAGAGIVLGGNNLGYASVLGKWPETLFDPKDQVQFKEKLEYYLKNPSEARKVGAKQHREAKDYDVNLVARKLLEIYKK